MFEASVALTCSLSALFKLIFVVERSRRLFVDRNVNHLMCLWVCVDIPEHPVELQSYQDYQDQGSIELFHMAIFTVETICDNGIYCCLKASIEPTWIKENSSQESI